MFERFDLHALQVTVRAQEQARSCNHLTAGTEHFLVALARCSGSMAAHVLADHGLNAARLETALFAVRPAEGVHPEKYVPFTSQSKVMLEWSLREALALGHNYIGAEHMLIALTGIRFCLGSVVLTALGTDPTSLRENTSSLVQEKVAAGHKPQMPTPQSP